MTAQQIKIGDRVRMVNFNGRNAGLVQYVRMNGKGTVLAIDGDRIRVQWNNTFITKMTCLCGGALYVYVEGIELI